MSGRWPIVLLVLLAAAAPGVADPSRTVILPPEQPWEGRSRTLALSSNHEWATPCERSDLQRTPRYDETVAWLQRLVAAAPQLKMVSLGKSAEGREIWMVVASREGAGDPQALTKNGRPTLLAHAGIHSGEIDGKDAGMMLLRDMTVLGKRRSLLDGANFLFVPILSVDAHERFGSFSRMNQRGPVESGWRTNRRNLNLNRDFAKLETEELRALAAAVVRWEPDLYLDLHVTDGADYQYDVTYGYNGRHGWSPKIAGWLDDVFSPAVSAALEEMGHVPGPLSFGANRRDMTGGNYVWTAPPRFSNGWGDARHLPTVLVENHSLKSYPRRVLGTYVMLDATLQLLGQEGDSLRKAAKQDRQRVAKEVPLGWEVVTDVEHPVKPFKGIRSVIELSAVSGAPQVRWTGEPEEIEIPYVQASKPTLLVRRPSAYYIPAAWYPIVDRLRAQGIEVERLDPAVTVEVERLRLPDASLDAGSTPYEGRALFLSGEPVVERGEITLPSGSFRVGTSQPLGTLAVLLLEPQGYDSLFRWGYFAEVLQRTEYFESYVMEPMAQAMLDADPALRKEFEEKLLGDAEFAGSAPARLDWFYEKTPYYDEEYRLYPVSRSVD